jgi:hypothetical protein
MEILVIERNENGSLVWVLKATVPCRAVPLSADRSLVCDDF